jgi:hypothetical protein
LEFKSVVIWRKHPFFFLGSIKQFSWDHINSSSIYCSYTVQGPGLGNRDGQMSFFCRRWGPVHLSTTSASFRTLTMHFDYLFICYIFFLSTRLSSRTSTIYSLVSWHSARHLMHTGDTAVSMDSKVHVHKTGKMFPKLGRDKIYCCYREF